MNISGKFSSAREMFEFLASELENHPDFSTSDYKEIIGVSLQLNEWKDIDELILDPVSGIGLQEELTSEDAIKNFDFLIAEFENWKLGLTGAWIKYPEYWEKRKGKSGRFEYHYGPRVYQGIHFILSKLSEDRNTRQAFFSVWSKEDEDLSRSQVPCTIGYHFLDRDNTLYCLAHFRSIEYSNFGNDVWLSARLFEWIAQSLNNNLRLGPITFFVDSFHKFVK